MVRQGNGWVLVEGAKGGTPTSPYASYANTPLIDGSPVVGMPPRSPSPYLTGTSSGLLPPASPRLGPPSSPHLAPASPQLSPQPNIGLGISQYTHKFGPAPLSLSQDTPRSPTFGSSIPTGATTGSPYAPFSPVVSPLPGTPAYGHFPPTPSLNEAGFPRTPSPRFAPSPRDFTERDD